jgi:radical SAM superfamily enzyme YgiQ (UPF0313 family)
MNNKSSSILITNLPTYDVLAPPGAFGMLTSVAASENYETVVADFNLYLYKNLSSAEWTDVNNYNDGRMTKLFIADALKKKIIKLWDKMLYDNIKSTNCDYLCISIFSMNSILIARILLEHEASKTKKTYKIIVGGNGTSSKFPETHETFMEWNNSNHLADYVVQGDGEDAFAKILSNGMTTYNITDLDSLPMSDYSNINVSEYLEPKLYMTTSRGCVRHCTFCDIEGIWSKYTFRTPESLVKEIKHHVETTGITTFDFTDSLINGSSTNFYKFNSLLASEKAKHSYLEDVTYMGQSICKSRKSMPESHFEAMHYAGCQQLTVGIESFSESVRNHMKKKFTNDDIAYYLEQCGYWRINNVVLMLVGYPTETMQDHQDNIDALYKYHRYSQLGIIELIRFGYTMQLHNGSPINSDRSLKELGVYYDSPNPTDEELTYMWRVTTNKDNTLAERLRRRMEMHELCVALNYMQPRVNDEMLYMKSLASLASLSHNKTP